MVRSRDLMTTFVLDVMGEFAIFRGLKFKIAEIILLAMEGRSRIRLPKLFRVAVTRSGSL